MGQTQSNLPSGKNYKCSYCKQITLPENDFLPEINLSNLINACAFNDNFIQQFIYIAIYYKIKNLGYNIKESTFFAFYIDKTNLKSIIKSVCDKIIIKDISKVYISYKVTLNNIKQLLSKGNILIAGIVLDEQLAMKIFEKDKFIKGISDIILIVGYSEQFIYIYTNWKTEIIKLDYNFIDNILEMWNIEVKSPEDEFLNVTLI